MTLSERVQTLTDSQKTCLRLVGRGMSSKEIAIETGLSPQTVDTYVKASLARLGVSNRREAARLLQGWEASQLSGSPAPTVANTDPPSDQPPTAGSGWQGARSLLPPPIGGRINQLGASERTYAILRVAFVSAATVLGIALLLAGALQTFR